MEPTPLKRRSGRLVVLVFAGLIAAIVVSALGFWLRGREPMGEIQRVVALDGHAAAIVRKGYRQNDFVHLTVRDVKHGQRWMMALWAVLEDAVPLVRGDTIALRVRDQMGRPETHAFSLSEGKFKWRAARVMRGSHDRVRGASLLGATRLFELSGGRAAEVFALDPETGRPYFHAQRAGGDGAVHGVVVGDGVIADLGDGVLVHFDAAGHPVELGRGSACAIAGSPLVLTTRGALSENGTGPDDSTLAGLSIAACTRTPTKDVVVLTGPKTRVLARPRAGGAFTTLAEDAAPLVTTYEAPTGTSGGTIPLVLTNGRLLLVDAESGRVTSHPLTSSPDAGHVILSDALNTLSHHDEVIAFLPNGEARVLRLGGGPSTPALTSVQGNVVFVARGEGIFAVDMVTREFVGTSGTIHASFLEGGLTRLGAQPR